SFGSILFLVAAGGPHYEIKIYDENSYSGSKDALVYYTMTVSSDYSSFKFSDANARYGGYTIEDTWTSLSYYGIQKVYSEIDTVSMVSSDSAETVSTSSGQTTLQVSVGKKFKIVNASGEWLQYDGSGYTGTMTVYDCYTMGAGDSQLWNLTVDVSDSFTLLNADAGCQLICEIEDQGYSYISNGEEQVVLSANKIEVTGESYALDIAVQSTSCDMVKISANVSGDATISVGSATIWVDAEGTCSDMEISTCFEFDTETQQIDEDVEKVVISQSGDIEDVIYGGDSKNGLCLDTDGVYHYYVKGEVDTTFNGIVEYDGGQFFVANGVLCSDANGLNLYDGKWYFLANGQLQIQYTGLALYDGEWFYISSGVLDTSKNGLVAYDGERFLVAEGHLLLTYNGLWQNAASIGGDDLWYFIGAGMVQNVSQVVMYDGAWFVVENGVLDSDYNGTIEYDGATFTVVAGQLYG
ncbi:MAG: hypothetical protein LUF30_02135, partial [Lachnospiraceae bacterium]|nr:hypothetical protein [Lachnospiraceae bacterium]